MNKELTFQDYSDILLKRRWLIILCIIIGTLGALFSSLRQPKIYEARVKFKLDLSRNRPFFFTELYTTKQVDPVESELEIIRSRSLIKSVVKKLGLNLLVKSPNLVPFDSVFIYNDTIFGQYFLKFENDTFLFINGNRKIIGKGVIGEIFDNGSIRFFLRDKPEENLEFTIIPLEKAVDYLMDYISVSQIKNTDLVLLKVKYFVPRLASSIANVIAQEYIKYSLERVRESARGTKEFIESQIKIFGAELDHAEENLRQFKEKTGVFLLSETAKEIISSLAKFETEKEKGMIELQEAETSIKKLEAELSRDEASYGIYKRIASFPTISNSPLIGELREKLKELELKKQEYLLEGTGSQELIEIESQIKKITDDINRATRQITLAGPTIEDPVFQSIMTNLVNNETKFFALQTRIEALNQIIAHYNLRLRQLPEAEVNLAQLERQKKANEEIYTMLLSKLEESKIAEAMQMGEAKIIDYGIIPDDPVEPKVRLNSILGFLLGLLIGIGSAFLLEYLDTSVKSTKEIEELTGISVLATIPIIKNKHPTEIPTVHEPHSETAEAYRILRTNILFASADKPIKSLLITSTVPQEGKTTTAINLGIIFSQLGNKILLLECDFRRPMLHKYLKNFIKGTNRGLSDVLVHQVKLNDTIIRSSVDNLYFITSGTIPSNPTELLGSKRMENLLDTLKNEFDFILIDAPPALGIADAQVLGKFCDGILIVLRVSKSNRNAIVEVKEELERAGEKIIGYVLNGIDMNNRYYRHRFHYYRHYVSS